LPHDPAILSTIGVYPKELKAGFWRDICKPMFIIGLFTIVNRQKQLKHPSTDEWIKKICSVYVYAYICVCVYVFIYVYAYTHEILFSL
jgi:hypothetical protein